MMLSRSFLALVMAVVLPAVVRAEQWTGPKEAAQAAREFAGGAQRLQKAIREVSDESPLAPEMERLSKSAIQFHDAVQKGAAYEEALKDFRKIESDYAHFEAGLKKAHDVHHDKQVDAEVTKTKAAFDHLQAQMAGKRSTDAKQSTSKP